MLDGAVRNLEQAKGFRQFFEDNSFENQVLVLEIHISDEESFDRLTKRRVCVKCGEIIPWLPATKNFKVCAKCGGDLKARQDDGAMVIKERIKKQGNAAIKKILEYYKKIGKIEKINGEQDIGKVQQDIDRVLRNYVD